MHVCILLKKHCVIWFLHSTKEINIPITTFQMNY